jgi:hypothetical protein
MSVYYSQPAPRPGGESVFQDATCRIVLLPPYLVVCSAADSSPSSSAVAGVRRGLEQLGKMSTHIGYLVVHDPPFRLGMAPEIRTGLALTLQRFEAQMSALAVVYDEVGFRATAIRSLVTAQHVANRPRHPAKVFAEVRAGLEWLHALVPESKVTLPELEQFVREQRKRLYTTTHGTPPPSSRR